MAGPLPLLREICPSVVASSGGEGGNDGYLTAQQYEALLNGGGGGSVEASMADLRDAGVPNPTQRFVTALGYYEEGDGGGGQFYWDSTSTAQDNGGTVIRPTAVSSGSPGRWLRLYKAGVLDPRWFGAIGDGDSHTLTSVGFATLAAAQEVYSFATSLSNEVDWCGLQAAINVVATRIPASAGDLDPYTVGGQVYVPKGVFICDQVLDCVSLRRIGMKLCGVGGIGAGGLFQGGGSTIVYDGVIDRDRFIDARSSYGFVLDGLSIYYEPGFTGYLVDFGHGPSASDTTKATIRGCALSGVNGTLGQGAAALVSFSRAIDCLVDNSILGTAVEALRFRDWAPNTNSYSNAHRVTNCQFIYHKYSICNAGESLFVCGNTFEGTGGELVHIYFDDLPWSSNDGTGVTFAFDGTNDTITRSAGSWIDDGWEVGHQVFAFYGQNNNGPLGSITTLTATVMTVDGALVTHNEPFITLCLSAVCGPVTFSDNWAGDQFAAQNWMNCRQSMFGLTLIGNQIVGQFTDRAVYLGRGAGPLTSIGNHYVTVLSPIYAYSGSNTGWSSIGDLSTVDPIIDPAAGAPTAGVLVGGSIPDSTASLLSSDFKFASGKGVVIRSPNGTQYRVTVDNAGVLSATAI